MRQKLAVSIGLGCAVALMAGPGVDVPDMPGSADEGGGSSVQVILELNPGVLIQQINADYALATLAAIPTRRLYLLQTTAGVDEAALQSALDDDPRVSDAEVNEDCQSPEAAGGDTQPFFFYVPPGEYANQYALDRVGLPEALLISTGDGVTAAVIDTGVDATHPGLDGRVLPTGYNFVDGNTDCDDVASGADTDGDGVPDELTGHGTFMAGIIAVVAPDAAILPVRVLDSDGSSDLFRVVQGIYFAIDAGVDVINLSLDTRSHNHILRDAVDAAREAGIVVVASVGNEDRHVPVPLPAGHDTVIGVAATDGLDHKADFSNYGQYVSLSAPGWGVTSTLPGDAYATASGTSMGTAIVAGAAALLASAHPAATPDAIEAALLSSADGLDAANPGYAGQLGAGRLDIPGALAAMAADGPGPLDLDGRSVIMGIPLVLGAWGTAGSSADLDGSGVVDCGDLVVLIASRGSQP